MMVFRFLALLALLSACAAPQEQRLYLLETPPASLTRAVSASVIAVRAVDLPAYARSMAMAELKEDGSVQQSDVAGWADDPPRAVTVALGRLIAAKSGAEVVTEPWPSDARPDLVVAVLVDRFIGALGGAVTLSGRFTVTGRERGALRATSLFDISAPSLGPGYEGVARAHGAALDALAEQIVQSLP